MALSIGVAATSCTPQEQYAWRIKEGLANDGTGRSNDPIVRAVEDSAEHFGLVPNQLFGLAACESELHPDANNGIAGGLFQHLFRHWDGRVARYNAANPDFLLPDSDIYNPVSNARVTAWMIKDDGPGPWDCYGCYRNPYADRAGNTQAYCHTQAWLDRVQSKT
jgi:hypothetical protein